VGLLTVAPGDFRAAIEAALQGTKQKH